jgi:hypothetical protein
MNEPVNLRWLCILLVAAISYNLHSDATYFNYSTNNNDTSNYIQRKRKVTCKTLYKVILYLLSLVLKDFMKKLLVES